MLAAYRRRRRIDRRGGIWFTDSLVRVFSNDIAPIRITRGMGLALLGALPPAKNFVVRRMTFGARG
jgi:2-octaprenyl-6-methoxyphenol hydroxylase